MSENLLDILASMPEIQRKEVVAMMTPEQLQYLLHDWHSMARPEQLPPNDPNWSQWIFMGGRGTGKTRAASEMVREWGKIPTARIALVGPTAADVRDTMVEGISGILTVCPPNERPEYVTTKRKLVFPSGGIAYLYSSQEPERLRGPNHSHAWGDEISYWKHSENTLDMLRFTLRMGKNPQVLFTMTPKPTNLIKSLIAPEENHYITTSSTMANKANLSPQFLKDIFKRYDGTRIGRQELYAELLEDVEGAIVTHQHISDARIEIEEDINLILDKLVRIEVAVDPAVTNHKKSDHTGIIVAGKDEEGEVYILRDLSMKGSPEQWATVAINAAKEFNADRIIAETNNGGDLVISTLRAVDRSIRIDKVTASRGKHIRFAPVGALYEQGKVHHVGRYPLLEEQLCLFSLDGYEGGDSPDRADALVWAVTSLVLGKRKGRAAFLS